MSKEPTLLVFPSTDTLAPVLRTYILRAQSDALARHDHFSVGISGGSLPATLAKALLAPPSPSSSSTNDTIHWSKWHMFYADERCVPLDHSDSNHKLVQTELLDKIPKGGSEGQPIVYPIDEKLVSDPQEAADAYEKTLVAHFAAKDSVRLPIFDLLLLGSGPDGHTCSLFPQHPLLREEDAWVASLTDSPKPPPSRITLTLPVVTHANKIAFVSTGSGKAEIMRKAFDGDGEDLPIGIVNARGGGKVTWLCDEGATEGVRYQRKSSL